MKLLFIGLDEKAASIGLALGEAGVEVERIGYDRSRDAVRNAQASGAIQRVVADPLTQAKHADIILLSLSAPRARQMLEDLAPELKDGAAILDMSPLQSSSLRWSQAKLPEGRHYIGALPVVRYEALQMGQLSYADAQADLFEGGLVALVVPAETPEDIVNLAVNLVRAIGAQPFFVDPAEMDAITSIIDTLPALLGIALLRLASDSHGWKDIQRLAGRAFASTTQFAASHQAENLRKKLQDNRQSLTTYLEELIEVLISLRHMLDEADSEALEALLRDAIAAHDGWMAARQRGDWQEEEIGSSAASNRGFVASLFGFDSERRKRRR